jgi:hypothetical protein
MLSGGPDFYSRKDRPGIGPSLSLENLPLMPLWPCRSTGLWRAHLEPRGSLGELRTVGSQDSLTGKQRPARNKIPTLNAEGTVAQKHHQGELTPVLNAVRSERAGFPATRR